MTFQKYQHIERFGTDEVQDIELGICYLTPKIDGTLGTLWLDDEGNLKAGSRNRELTLENDNQGFYKYVLNDDRFINYLRRHPNHRLFGEWLVKHSLTTYRKDAWRKFYIFDVVLDKEDGFEYLIYETYKPLLEEFNLDYIPPLCIIKNGSYEKFVDWLDKNIFLIEDGKGVGEGIVIRNYNFYNRFGRQTWSKIVRSEFKELHTKTMGAPELNGKSMVEEEIVNNFCTEALIEKTYSKIINEQDGWRSQYIPRLLETVFYDLINEETWHILKKFKNPTINYKTLKHFTTQKIKETKPDLFC